MFETLCFALSPQILSCSVLFTCASQYVLVHFSPQRCKNNPSKVAQTLLYIHYSSIRRQQVMLYYLNNMDTSSVHYNDPHHLIPGRPNLIPYYHPTSVIYGHLFIANTIRAHTHIGMSLRCCSLQTM